MPVLKQHQIFPHYLNSKAMATPFGKMIRLFPWDIFRLLWEIFILFKCQLIHFSLVKTEFDGFLKIVTFWFLCCTISLNFESFFKCNQFAILNKACILHK